MSDKFFERPIINSPYEYPGKHWQLDETGQPTGKLVEARRTVDFVAPIPKPKKSTAGQQSLSLDGTGLTEGDQQYDLAKTIDGVRRRVDAWREIPDKNNWKVTPETARLLEHWRGHNFNDRRPFFCQVEAAETAIWLTEVAPKLGAAEKNFLEYLDSVNDDANGGMPRLALKLATGAGKTTVMAMLIAWQTINAVRHPTSSRFTRGFLIVTPGITIRDRLRVLQPNDPDSYYAGWDLVPREYLQDLERAKIVITNFHAFKLRETMEISAGGRKLLQGRGEPIQTLETEGQMLQRVMKDLMGIKNVIAINDEAHHCYREKPGVPDEEKLKGDDRKEAEKNKEAARLWFNGLDAVARHVGLSRVFDLSATPFFLRGSGYREGSLFQWVMSDFSLMDAIECGIVKLPRVPVADNIPGAEMPIYRDLWAHIGKQMPKKGRGKAGDLDPLDIPSQLQTALEALYGHYEKTAELWEQAKIEVPPCFIVVCNNTSSSKLVADYIAGHMQTDADGNQQWVKARLPRFSNFDEHGNPLARPRTLLIDSEQLESGEALDKNFREVAASEIERFRDDIVRRTGDAEQARKISDQDLLREVMNTVGTKGRLGESVRCVVSVSMLTEGWDTRTVTHVLGVRAFGTQLLCEQVVGRALRRQSYDLNEEGLFNVEYADVLGVPFDFTAKPVPAPPQAPRETIHVHAVSPERDALEIRFPRVAGYRMELPAKDLDAKFRDDSVLRLTPELIGPTKTLNEAIVGEGVTLDLEHTEATRPSTVVMYLTKCLMEKWRAPGEATPFNLYGQLKRIARRWLAECLVCEGGTNPAQILYAAPADEACERIIKAIVSRTSSDQQPIKAMLDPFNPLGSTRHVNFNTSKPLRWRTDPRRSHLNYAICDSRWEQEFCRVLEAHSRVLAYTRTHGLGFEVPYRFQAVQRRYVPDFIVLIDDGNGFGDPLHLVAEVKGFRGEDAKQKAETMRGSWVPGVNSLKSFGRWRFAEFTEVFQMEEDFERLVEEAVNAGIEAAMTPEPDMPAEVEEALRDAQLSEIAQTEVGGESDRQDA